MAEPVDARGGEQGGAAGVENVDAADAVVVDPSGKRAAAGALDAELRRMAGGEAGTPGLEARLAEEEWGGPGVKVHEVGASVVVGVDDETEIFRSVWKYYKRNANVIAQYVRDVEADTDLQAPRKRPRPRSIPCLDFDNLGNSPASLRALVNPVNLAAGQTGDANENGADDVRLTRAFQVQGRPGFVFVPNPFRDADREAAWTSRLAIDFLDSSLAERNQLRSGEEAAPLDASLRWATLGYHYDWRNREYTEDRRSTFPPELAALAEGLCKCLGSSIVPETAIINYYRKGATMGGHKDDAEWTDEAPVVSVSFGNAGVYVLGGDSQTDAGPPPPLPVIVRSGDVVLLGGPSRMNLHGVPCMLRNTLPSRLRAALERREASAGASARGLALYMNETRINVNVRQVKASAALLRLFKRAK